MLNIMCRILSIKILTHAKPHGKLNKNMCVLCEKLCRMQWTKRTQSSNPSLRSGGKRETSWNGIFGGLGALDGARHGSRLAGAADGTYQNAVYPERICRKAQPTTSIRINRNGTPVVEKSITVSIPTGDEPYKDMYTADALFQDLKVNHEATCNISLHAEDKTIVDENTNNGVTFRRERRTK